MERGPLGYVPIDMKYGGHCQKVVASQTSTAANIGGSPTMADFGAGADLGMSIDLDEGDSSVINQFTSDKVRAAIEESNLASQRLATSRPPQTKLTVLASNIGRRPNQPLERPSVKGSARDPALTAPTTTVTVTDPAMSLANVSAGSTGADEPKASINSAENRRASQSGSSVASSTGS